VTCAGRVATGPGQRSRKRARIVPTAAIAPDMPRVRVYCRSLQGHTFVCSSRAALLETPLASDALRRTCLPEAVPKGWSRWRPLPEFVSSHVCARAAVCPRCIYHSVVTRGPRHTELSVSTVKVALVPQSCWLSWSRGSRRRGARPWRYIIAQARLHLASARISTPSTKRQTRP
jgi:hypothetical protein